MSPMRATYHCRCEAGIKGGHSELDRESRRAELDMDRLTNSRQNRRHFLQAYASYMACSQNGTGSRARQSCVVALSTLARSRRKVRSFIQRQTETRNGVTPPRLSGVRRSRRYVASLDVGRIASEANAFGKAEGHADRGTVSGR